MKTTIGKTTLLLAVVGPTLMALPAFGGVGPCLSGGQIGACPGWVDVNGNGVYDPGEPLIGFSMNGNVLTIVDPWSNACGETSGHMITFGNSTGCGYTTASTTTNPVEGTQMITATGNPPNAFSYVGSGIPGTGTLMPSSGPPYSGIQVTGGTLDMLVGPFQGVDASGGNGTFNHATIPWAQASMLGMNGACGKIAFPNGDPQIFVPVVHQEDGNFKIVPSFPGMCSSPEIVLAAFQPAINIPTLSEWGLIVLLVGVGMAGWVLLRRSGVLA